MDLRSTGQDILEKFESFFEKNKITLKNLLSIASDGAPSISGKNKEFIALYQKNITKFSQFTVFYIGTVDNKKYAKKSGKYT